MTIPAKPRVHLAAHDTTCIREFPNYARTRGECPSLWRRIERLRKNRLSAGEFDSGQADFATRILFVQTSERIHSLTPQARSLHEWIRHWSSRQPARESPSQLNPDRAPPRLIGARLRNPVAPFFWGQAATPKSPEST